MSARRGPAGPLAAIVQALGGELYDGGARALVPGPGHSPADRSLSLWLHDGRLLVHSFAGDDWRAVRDVLRRRGLLAGVAEVTGGGVDAGAGPSGAPAVAPRVVPSRRRLLIAQALWAAARPAAGTLAETHVRGRGVGGSPPPALRFHPAVPAAVYRDAGPTSPALLARIDDAAGALSGVEVTYLAPNGSRDRRPVARKIVGSRPPGAAVRLADPGPVLAVAEGVFSALSAGAALKAPAWAVLGAAAMARWSPPAGVRTVLVAGDRGAVGEQAAAALVRRLRRDGFGAVLRLPPDGAEDWNAA